jgi:aminoglycoside phosphotransferase (APT) family kinase protein
MHADELEIDEALVRRLLRGQYPDWADLALERVRSAGTDNAIYRLGPDRVIRLPRIRGARKQIEADQRWLPSLAPLLPLSIPEPLEVGRPDEGYPWPWAVHRWLEGENARIDRLDDPREAASALGRFVAAMQRVDLEDRPPPGMGRGGPLATRDEEMREAIAASEGLVDIVAATAAWDSALGQPEWDRPPVWVHGDLHAENMLASDGRLSAVIDWGCLGVGDPACDVMAAWLYLSGDTRDAFRAELEVDEATWARARGWALSVGVIALPYYLSTNPVFAAVARHAIEQVLADA